MQLFVNAGLKLFKSGLLFAEWTLVLFVFQLVYPQDVKLTEKEVSSDES